MDCSDNDEVMMPERILDLTDGVTMVVTDLHGDLEAFKRYTYRFLHLYDQQQAHRLLILGDLIHSRKDESEDHSLEMILEVIRLQQAMPPQTVIMLLGNHEMPHLYGVTLMQGDLEFTPRFERALTNSGKRDEVMRFLHTLPFYIRTAAGISFTHAGPNGNAMAQLDVLRHFDHQAILDEYDFALTYNPHPEQLRNLYSQFSGTGKTYEALVKHYLAVSGTDDPRYDHLVRAFMITKKSKEFELLWDALFSRCEEGGTMEMYTRLLQAFLAVISKDAPAPQRFMVTGHITVTGGHAVVTPQHLRIASAAHARPREAGKYLLWNFAQSVSTITDLEQALYSVY